MVATSIGWMLGGMVLPALALPAGGVFSGALQAILLKDRLPRPLRWVQASLAGWVLGYLLLVVLFSTGSPAINGIVLGLVVGIAQWLVLRHEVRWAGWWIIFSVMGWVTGLALLPGFLLTGTMAGLITGVALEILFWNRKGDA